MQEKFALTFIWQRSVNQRFKKIHIKRLDILRRYVDLFSLDCVIFIVIFGFEKLPESRIV